MIYNESTFYMFSFFVVVFFNKIHEVDFTYNFLMDQYLLKPAFADYYPRDMKYFNGGKLSLEQCNL